MKIVASIAIFLLCATALAPLIPKVDGNKPHMQGTEPTEPTPIDVVPGPEAYTTILLSAYGVSASNTAVQNDAALSRLNTALRGTTKPPYRLVIPPGTIRYTNRMWANGLNNWMLVAADATSRLQAENNYSFINTTMYLFGNGPGQPAHPNNIDTGIRFKNIPEGTTLIPLMYAKDTASFFVGQRIVLTGKERQAYGWPPNYAHFEFKRITGKGGDGAGNAWVTIGRYASDQPDATTFFYNNAWKDIRIDAGLRFYTGKPRIFKLDNKDYPSFVYAKKIVLDGIRFVPWKEDNASTTLAMPADSAFYLNGVHEGPGITLNATEQFYTLIKNWRFNDFDGVEADKVNWKVELIGGSGASGLAAGNGTRYLRTKGFEHHKGTWASPHIWELDSCAWVVSGTGDFMVKRQPEGHVTHYAKIRKLRFNVPQAKEGGTELCFIHTTPVFKPGTVMYVDPNDAHSFILDNSRAFGTEGRDWMKSFSAPYKMKFWRNDGQKFARVVDVVEHEAGWKVITAGDALQNGERWSFPFVGYIIDQGGHTNDIWGVPALSGTDIKWKGNLSHNDTATRTTTWNEKDFKWVSGGQYPFIGIAGTIQKIRVIVDRPFVGRGNSKLIFYKDATNVQYNTHRIFEIDLKQSGERVIAGSNSGGSASGLKSGEYAKPALLAGWVGSIGYDATIPGNNATPKPTLLSFRVIVTWTPYTKTHP